MRDRGSAGKGRAAELLHEARVRSGLTQAQLAELARTAQSAISSYESGGREPTVPVLARLVAATGHRLELEVTRDLGCYRIADVARDIAVVAADDEQRRLRLVFEFLRGAADDGCPLVLLVAADPPLTGDARFDALLAAIAEDLCVRAGTPPPLWVHAPDRFLDGAWWVSSLPSARAVALVHTPASYRRRGVMISRDDLEAA